jgi:drug/metabolite transporter (DMT)-like permease
MRTAAMFAAVAPWLFVVVWSTGFIATKIGLRDSPPLTLLVMRFGAAALMLAVIAALLGNRWPRNRITLGHLAIAGLLNQAGYLGFSFHANALGMPVSILALIGALQPVLTALGAQWLLRERVTCIQWLGLMLGLIGVILVLFDRVAFVPTDVMIAFAFTSILSITAGTLYVKRFCVDADLLCGTCVQFISATIVLGIAAVLLEDMHVRWHLGFFGTFAWLVIVNSVFSVNLLYWLVRRGMASRVASLFYLVPVATSIMAYGLVDERFGPHFVVGSIVAIVGVLIATGAPRGAGGSASG